MEIPILCHLWNVLDFVSLALKTPILTTHFSSVLTEEITQQGLHIFLYLTW